MDRASKGCFCCTKSFLFILNLLFWMLGASLLGLGIWLHVTNDSMLELSPGYTLLTPAALFMAPGCLSIIVGFLGCCGTVTENRCMITSYCILAALVIVLEISAGAATFVFKSQLNDHIEDQLRLSLAERYPDPDSAVKTDQDLHYIRGWDRLQQKLECCGVDRSSDWFGSHGWPSKNRVPESCCITPYPGCGEIYDPENWHAQGCMKPVGEFIGLHLYTCGITVLVFAAVQLLAIIGAIIFLVFYKKKKMDSSRLRS